MTSTEPFPTFPGPSDHSRINNVGRDQHNQTNIISGDQHNVTKNIYETRGVINDILLESLKPAEMDCTMRTGCLGDTRADVLAQVIDWACKSAPMQRTLWLHGPAGSGKSTISTTLVERFRQSKQLGAFLFFNRDNTERSNPALVARNLAHQISLSYPEIGVFIISAVENNSHTLTSPISSQFQELIVNPLSSVSTNSPIVLVLDALDECGTNTDRKALLDALAEQSAYLPPTSRLIITSRSDLDMRLAFQFQAHVKPLELDLTSAATQRDIMTYIQHQMKSINKKNRYLGQAWPGEKTIKALMHRARGLFVWASIVCSFIDAHDPRKRLDIILRGNQASTADAALDSLYQTALKVIGMWDDADFVEDFRSIIGIMLVIRNPLTTIAIDNLLANPDGRPSSQTIEKLSCLICSNPTVRFIHPSVADFLMDKSRGNNEIWFFTPAFCERSLAILCLRRLSQVLHRDMSQFALLVDREDDTIPKDVTYACVFWVDHVCMVEDDLPLIDQLLETFIDQHILHWFEAMSLLHRFGLAITLLGQLSDWTKSRGHRFNRRGVQQLVRHWWRFSEEYEERIRECPMLVYSEELRQEFPLTQVQEPLISRPPAPSIFDLDTGTQSPTEVSSQYFPSPSISWAASSRVSDSRDPMPPVSRSASPTRLGRRLSRSSLDHPRHRSSSASSMTHRVSRRLSRSSLDLPRHRSSSVLSMAQQASPSDASFSGSGLCSPPNSHKGTFSTWTTNYHNRTKKETHELHPFSRSANSAYPGHDVYKDPFPTNHYDPSKNNDNPIARARGTHEPEPFEEFSAGGGSDLVDDPPLLSQPLGSPRVGCAPKRKNSLMQRFHKMWDSSNMPVFRKREETRQRGYEGESLSGSEFYYENAGQTSTFGFASNFSQTINQASREDDDRSAHSDASITDEELALLGAPWAKEGMLCRKQYREPPGKRAKVRTWLDVCVVIKKGELNMFSIGEHGGEVSGTVGGRNWQSVGTVNLAHSLAHALPPPGYNTQRPHCLVLTLSNGSVYFFQAGTEELVNEWVSTCNYWAARTSKKPLTGSIGNTEYGWNRVVDTLVHERATTSGRSNSSNRRTFRSTDVRSAMRSSHSLYEDKVYINDWKCPLPSTLSGVYDEESQMEALQNHVASIKRDLKCHNALRQPMSALYEPLSSNAVKSQTNWEKKSRYLLTEIVKYDSYIDSLRSAMTLRLKKRGEKHLERVLIASSP